jgi:2-polyprenyl-3-methyl-5-hydroxy-6-metoxy-1,4-benzoquinol methylase
MDQVLKSKAERYYDNFVDRLLTDYVQSNPRAEKAIKFSTKWLQLANCKNILDIGCGIGWSSSEFSSHLPNCKVSGLDLSPSLIETAKLLFAKTSGAKFSVTDITSPEFKPDLKYDGIIMLDLYEHIPQKDRAGFHASVKNCLGDQFVIILTCPSASFQNFLRQNNPELLQPVDEDVLEEDAKLFADHVGAELILFEPISIWQTNDYNHILISKNKDMTKENPGKDIILESRDSKISRVSKTQFKPILKKFGTSTWAKAQFPFLIYLSKILKG